MAELVYAHGLGPCSVRIGGSSPLSPTMKISFSLEQRERLKEIFIMLWVREGENAGANKVSEAGSRGDVLLTNEVS